MKRQELVAYIDSFCRQYQNQTTIHYENKPARNSLHPTMKPTHGGAHPPDRQADEQFQQAGMECRRLFRRQRFHADGGGAVRAQRVFDGAG